MPESTTFNDRIIDEFRANDGVVGGPFEGIPILLLHTIGARTGAPRVNPLAYQRDGDRVVVFASNAGKVRHPDWYFNVLAHPRVTVEVGTERLDLMAHVATGDTRARLWKQQKEIAPVFTTYEESAKRPIPVIVIEQPY